MRCVNLQGTYKVITIISNRYGFGNSNVRISQKLIFTPPIKVVLGIGKPAFIS